MVVVFQLMKEIGNNAIFGVVEQTTCLLYFDFAIEFPHGFVSGMQMVVGKGQGCSTSRTKQFFLSQENGKTTRAAFRKKEIDEVFEHKKGVC